ncbi:MAG: NAD-glutamate dehydrogenase [Micrococcaceae bacterium]
MSPEKSLSKIIAKELAIDKTAKFTKEEIEQIAQEQCRLGQERKPGDIFCQLSLINNRTYVHVITNDMPFLIDSVSGELNRQKCSILQNIHPILMIERDGEELVGIEEAKPTHDADSSSTMPLPVIKDKAKLESWSVFEIARTLNEERAQDIRRSVIEVLKDVHYAVADWKSMLKELEDVKKSLAEIPESAGVSDQVETVKNFLDWLGENNYTFLGYREYVLDKYGSEDVLAPLKDTGLGLLKNKADHKVHLTKEGQRKAREKKILIVTKTNRRSTVHRNAYLDYVGVKTFDKQGNVVGERRFIGLFASSAYTSSVRNIPLVKEKVQEVVKGSGYSAASHSGKDFITILETYPRDELFQMDTDELSRTANEILLLSERRKTRVFLRPDVYGRFFSAIVYLPKDRYNTNVRLRIEEALKHHLDVKTIDYDTHITDSALARLYFMIRLAEPVDKADELVDAQQIEIEIAEAVRSWNEGIQYKLNKDSASLERENLAKTWAGAFSENYKAFYDIDTAIADIETFQKLKEQEDVEGLKHVVQWEKSEDDYTDYRIRLFVEKPQSLSDIVPFFHHSGFVVVEERPFTVTPEGTEPVYIYDIGVILAERNKDLTINPEKIQDSFSQRLSKVAETDYYSRLVTYCNITEREVALFRALSRYLRQVRSTHSYGLIGNTLLSHPEFVKYTLKYFKARFSPVKNSEEQAEKAVKKINKAIDNVATLEADAILRALFEILQGIIRTNYYQRTTERQPKPYISFKLQPRKISVVPEPRPQYEIFVYSPEVEGVHLRFGDIARGGLRWSDRREDFRTEILGLVKAQEVKNAVIIPSGAKGGFYVKNPVDPSDRAAWMEQGQACYRTFLRGLLDITDNRDLSKAGDAIIPPKDVVRLDYNDDYLVVAADKGTASFSDIANSISAEYGFWLGDAFASGGSVGYDHKAMGITARGAWESAKHHFRNLGVDIQNEDFTAVGIGDMSGDVFGNGMMLSKHTRLIAAFDHRHIFIDPNPDAASTFAERVRLFNLPRSSWEDFNSELISEGGGVYSRELKSIPVSKAAKEALGIETEAETMTPIELMKAVLSAKVDLFFNGGIGTYVKASTESDKDAADRANDIIRINGEDLRVKVVAEGGNLGFTQKGRIEAANKGILINTDAIDNSAGVDCSDHEVNIKILLDSIVSNGKLAQEARNELLADMTDEVGYLVLEDNIQQNILLSNDIFRLKHYLPFYRRMMDELENTAGLDRDIESLPSDAEIQVRPEATALTRPEISVLAAYAKISLSKELIASDFSEDPWLESVLVKYFPTPLQEQYAKEINEHPLRSNIISTLCANFFINTVGVTADFRLREETGCSASQAAKAFMIASGIFNIPTLLQHIESLANQIDTETYLQMHRNIERLLDRAMRRLVRSSNDNLNISESLEKYQPMIAELWDDLTSILGPSDRKRAQTRSAEWVAGGVTKEQADIIAVLLETFTFMDIADIANEHGLSPKIVAKCYFFLSENYGMDSLLTFISKLPRVSRWDSLARAAMRDDLYATVALICNQIVDTLPKDATIADTEEHLAKWEKRNKQTLDSLGATFAEIANMKESDLAPIAVALRQIRNVMER